VHVRIPRIRLDEAQALSDEIASPDSSGSVIPAVNITLTNSETGVALTATTNEAGLSLSYWVEKIGPPDYGFTTAQWGWPASVVSQLTKSTLAPRIGRRFAPADAARNGDKRSVRTLVEQRADINATEVDGTTALHWAVYQDDLEDDTAVAQKPGPTPT
jgi:hypothetical protein